MLVATRLNLGHVTLAEFESGECACTFVCGMYEYSVAAFVEFTSAVVVCYTAGGS